MIREYLRRAYRTLLPMLYARSQFKLFLKSSLEEVDARVRSLAAVTDIFSPLIRPIPIRAPFGKSVLVVAPHQDDEAIGCGGAIALQAASGRPVQIVILQDGADGHDEFGMSRAQLTELRNQESSRAAAMLNGASIRFLNHAQLALNIKKGSEELVEILAGHRIDAVFTPFVLDGHPDHRAANCILAMALKQIPHDVRVFGYEVWGLCVPNVLVVIDEVIDKKLAMLACYSFANKAVDYVNSTRGLNMYRSRLIGAGEGKYVECFFELPRQEFIALVERIDAEEKQPFLA